MNKEDYILKSKITKILGLEDDSNEEIILNLIKTIVDENNRLEDIEDRKVQIEYNNVFNKGVKSVEDKIKEKMKKYEWAIEHYDCNEADYKQSQDVGSWNILRQLLEENKSL